MQKINENSNYQPILQGVPINSLFATFDVMPSFDRFTLIDSLIPPILLSTMFKLKLKISKILPSIILSFVFSTTFY